MQNMSVIVNLMRSKNEEKIEIERPVHIYLRVLRLKHSNPNTGISIYVHHKNSPSSYVYFVTNDNTELYCKYYINGKEGSKELRYASLYTSESTKVDYILLNMYDEEEYNFVKSALEKL
jgi:hypothetical protein